MKKFIKTITIIGFFSILSSGTIFANSKKVISQEKKNSNKITITTIIEENHETEKNKDDKKQKPSYKQKPSKDRPEDFRKNNRRNFEKELKRKPKREFFPPKPEDDFPPKRKPLPPKEKEPEDLEHHHKFFIDFLFEL